MSLREYLPQRTFHLWWLPSRNTYDLTPMPVGGDNGSEDVTLKEDGELPEGPAPM